MQTEEEIIKKKFELHIKEGKITKPKHNKKDFFKKKAESSLRLARTLLEREEYLDWCINISYYSMFYNATSLLAHNNVDITEINENTHLLTYQALVYFYHLKDNKIEQQYLEDFKQSMKDSDARLQTIAKQKTKEILGSFRKAKEQRARTTYELGKTAEQQSAQAAVRRAERFSIITEKLMIEK